MTHKYFFGGGTISDEKWARAFGRYDTLAVFKEFHDRWNDLFRVIAKEMRLVWLADKISERLSRK